MTPAQHASTARALLHAEAERTQIGLLSLQYPEMEMRDAYAIQNEILNAKRASGRSVIGWKIGLTSKAMQSALNIDIPDSGVLFDDMLFDHDGLVPKDRFIQPRVEAEIAFVFKSPLGGAHLSAEDVINATDYVTPSLEILDTRIVRQDPQSGKARTVLDTISDNAANAGVVLGAEKHVISSHDLRWVGAIVSRDKEVEETGLGAGVLNDPVTSVLWLAQRMAQYGQKIEPGQIVLSGSFIRPIECPSGSHIHADFGAFGQVAISFE